MKPVALIREVARKLDMSTLSVYVENEVLQGDLISSNSKYYDRNHCRSANSPFFRL